ncbi:hypothetical protein AB833_19045 [Chromatiales bacterium (ex Bugula neritina AB1)]|nr:hypothetical protein AB833_19045 [Chromatiales bacterium (ex Bugula neritina AB1)]
MGSDRHYREERPQREVYVPEFTIDVHEVTNRQFAEFVRQTGYITTAEKIPLAVDNPGIPAQFLVAGSAVFVSPADGKAGHWTDWWQFVPGTSWKNPEGPGSDIAGRENHPVVHVSYLDAKAYAQWAGRSLPVEAQWERAAKALGDSLAANTWQGVFPLQNRSLDGFAGTAPVGCFAANDLGIHDMIGNVWEWVDDPYSEAGPAAQERVRTGSAAKAIKRVVKGGSYLCASNYCRRDRPQARQSQEENFGSAHIGFRTVSQLPVD